MHSFARHRSQHANEGDSATKGLILNAGRGYDLTAWFFDAFWFRGQWRKLRHRTLNLADVQSGERVLDVGCGTGTLALEVQRRVGATGYVVGIDPGEQQIASARAKAARRKLASDFQIGVIERLAFPADTFDLVLSSLMMHHLPADLKRQGLAEIARVLKPGGRLVIADFQRKKDRQGRAVRFHAGGSNIQDLAILVRDTGFARVETQEMAPARFSAFPGAGFIRAYKGQAGQ